MDESIELIIAAFNDEKKADAVLKEMRALDRDGILAVLNAAIMVKTQEGKVSMKETEDVSGKQGAIFGAIAGGILGLLGGPAGVIVGAAAGAATGGLAANQIDMGFSDEALKDIQQGLEPGSSAIIALVEHEWIERILDEFEKYEAKLFRQALKDEITSQLKAANDPEE
jgi:uncharacterized membrane protein